MQEFRKQKIHFSWIEVLFYKGQFFFVCQFLLNDRSQIYNPSNVLQTLNYTLNKQSTKQQ